MQSPDMVFYVCNGLIRGSWGEVAAQFVFVGAATVMFQVLPGSGTHKLLLTFKCCAREFHRFYACELGLDMRLLLFEGFSGFGFELDSRCLQLLSLTV